MRIDDFSLSFLYFHFRYLILFSLLFFDPSLCWITSILSYKHENNSAIHFLPSVHRFGYPISFSYVIPLLADNAELSFTLSSQTDMITVMATFNATGNFWCKAFPASSAAPSVEVLKESTFTSEIEQNVETPLVIDQLSPSTSYDVYCYAEESDGTAMASSISDIKQTISTQDRMLRPPSLSYSSRWTPPFLQSHWNQRQHRRPRRRHCLRHRLLQGLFRLSRHSYRWGPQEWGFFQALRSQCRGHSRSHWSWDQHRLRRLLLRWGCWGTSHAWDHCKPEADHHHWAYLLPSSVMSNFCLRHPLLHRLRQAH